MAWLAKLWYKGLYNHINGFCSTDCKSDYSCSTPSGLEYLIEGMFCATDCIRGYSGSTHSGLEGIILIIVSIRNYTKVSYK